MTRNKTRVPAILTHTWVAAALVGFAVGSEAHAGQFGDFGIFSGYRQDTQSFSICSGLSNPDFYGYGKLKARQVHIWEIGAQASYRFTEHFALNAQIDYGKVLGGKIKDSGVADINSNPFNSAIGRLYTECCAPCNCETGECLCPCAADRIFVPSTQVTAGAAGHVWDFNAGLSYAFELSDSFYLTPSIGYAYNQQRTKYRNAAWGPVSTGYLLIPCDPELATYTTTTGQIDGSDHLVMTNNPAGFAGFFDGADVPDGANANRSCVSFGNCFDGTSYRSSWNGGFLGLDLAYVHNDRFAFNLGYRFYLQNYTGKFAAFGGCDGQSCACDLCPNFYSIAGGESFTDPDRTLTSYGFAPSAMEFSSIAYGQEVAGSAEYRCGDWVAALYGGWQYRTASKCANNDCDSGTSVLNGAMLGFEGIALDTDAPIWSGASFQQARWSSWHVGVALARLF